MNARYIHQAPFDGPEHRKARGPNGRRLCRWCGVEVPKGRQTWCSDACVQEYMIRRDAGSLRRAVWARDRGVCAVCGLDADQLERVLYRLRRGAVLDRYANSHRYVTGRIREELRAHWRRRWERFRDRMLDGRWTTDHPHGTVSCWEADHIVPVVEGGGGMAGGLDNVRTLCVPCHRRETADLAARRANARRTNEKEKQ